MINISIICPTRNNLKYLKWAYNAIRDNQGDHIVELCVADDASEDGTWEWCVETEKTDPNFKWIRNMGPSRLGHTILYDKLVNEVATNDICMIYHADMYLCPGALDEIEKYVDKKTIVSLTRIEPPLHPDGPEKVLADWGVEPEQFNESAFLQWFMSPEADGYKPKHKWPTSGIFAPWAFYKSDFQEIGGHDPLYAPQSKEDSDIFNRFMLNGVNFVQTWEGCVYHMTCRGSRFNPTLTTPGTNSREWEEQNQKSTKNFIRKWGSFVKHDAMMQPIVPHKYNVAFVMYNGNLQFLAELEPWCDRIYSDEMYKVIGRWADYVEMEQINTKFDLYKRVLSIHQNDALNENDIIVEFDAIDFDQDAFNLIQKLPQLLDQISDTGIYTIGKLKITVNALTHYESDLIKIQTQYN